MANPKLIVIPFAENGTRNDIPEAGADQPQKATMSSGWGVITETPIGDGGIPPERADFNGLGYLTTSHLAFLNKGQRYGFDPSLPSGYPINAQLMLESGEMVQSEINNNTNNPNNDMTGWSLISSKKVLVEDKTYADVLGAPVRFRLNPVMASLVYGINDPTHLDDGLNNFRGLNNPNAWDASNIGIGGFAVGRNNPPFAYLSFAFGHDCVGFGVASITGGAGSCTGNPDDPNESTGKYGYCSLAIGKETQARGRISNAMGHRNLSESLYSSTDGYNCTAGESKTTDPDYLPDGTQGVTARAHGYESQAYGNFAFSYGAFLRAYNGGQAIGKGYSNSSGTINPLVVSKRGVGIGYNVAVPTIFCKEGDMTGAWVGFNTQNPISKYDYRLGQSDTTSHTIDAQGGSSTVTATDVKGLLANGSYASLHTVFVYHTSTTEAAGTIQYRINGTEYLTVNKTQDCTFFKGINIGGGGLSVAGTRVVGGQLPAIANLATTATLAETITKVNDLLGALRAHGLIAT